MTSLEIEDDRVIDELKKEYPIPGTSWDYFIMCLLVAWQELVSEQQKASILGNLLGWSVMHNKVDWTMEDVRNAVYKRG
jgi:cell division FtsZ-interacting protein ZapD